MNGARVHVLAIASLLVLTGVPAVTRAADGDCTTARCQNPTAIADMRTSIAAECDCAGAANGAKYMKCVKRVVNDAISAGIFSRACKSAVAKCEAAVGCGRGIRPFRTVQQIFTQSCALPSCHSPIMRQGGLVLDTEDVSYTSLVNRPVTNADPAASGATLVVPRDPNASFLIKKLKGTAPGDRMPQSGEPLSKGTIKLIEKWIKRGALTTEQECPPADSAAAKKKGRKSCNDRPLRAGNYVWEPQPALPTPEAEGQAGFQMYTPPRDVAPGTEWETCYAFKNIDWLGMAAQLGYPPGQLPVIKAQTYRMHPGSHHLLLYAYSGPNPQAWADGYFPCSAAQCGEQNPNDCPQDPPGTALQLPIGGTQVAGTRYEVNYPEGVGIPVLSPNMVLIANLHYTNPFQPPQPIHGESWLNIYFHRPGEFKALLDGIFGINFSDLFVEPYQTRTISRVWSPVGLLDRQPHDAAVFQLFGHMHKRGTAFQIDILRGGHCSGTAMRPCGRDDDCQAGQTCVRPPGAEDSTVYYTKAWDQAPVMDFQKPYLLVNKDQGLRWTCTHVNGVEGDPTRPPKRCHEGCNACGWVDGRCSTNGQLCRVGGSGCEADETCVADGTGLSPSGFRCRDARNRWRSFCCPGSCTPSDDARMCWFSEGVERGFQPAPPRVYPLGEPMPVIFGELADDDMCNMFGYYIHQEDLAKLP
jgi:hypothetical protein